MWVAISEGAESEVLEQWSSHERETEEQQRRDERQAQYDEETNPKRRLFHKTIVLMSAVAVVSSFLMAVGQLIGMMYQTEGPIQYVLRFYVFLLCFLAILTELEWTSFARESAILRFWVTRGFFYSFIGLLGLEENDTSADKDDSSFKNLDAAREFTKVVAWMIIGVGIAYSLMGLCCLQVLYKRQRADFEARVERASVVRESAASFLDTDTTPA